MHRRNAGPVPVARQAPGSHRAALWRRVVLLLGCIAAGTLVGLLGQAATGQTAWFLAVPVAVALGWLAVADPRQCEPPPPPPR